MEPSNNERIWTDNIFHYWRLKRCKYTEKYATVHRNNFTMKVLGEFIIRGFTVYTCNVVVFSITKYGSAIIIGVTHFPTLCSLFAFL